MHHKWSWRTWWLACQAVQACFLQVPHDSKIFLLSDKAPSYPHTSSFPIIRTAGVVVKIKSWALSVWKKPNILSQSTWPLIFMLPIPVWTGGQYTFKAHRSSFTFLPSTETLLGNWTVCRGTNSACISVVGYLIGNREKLILYILDSRYFSRHRQFKTNNPN